MNKYNLQLIYSFGSRAEEVYNLVEGKIGQVDVVEIPEASAFLALEIVQGELLYADDETFEAEYQLYIMRRAADLMPHERMKQKLILGF